MSDLTMLFEVFKSDDLTVQMKCRLIIKLGKAINNSVGMNLTEEIVYEFISQLDSTHEILSDELYLRFVQ